MTHPIILASASPYKRRLLERLQLPFTWLDARVDETPGTSETAAGLAERLAQAKALAAAREHPGALVIGADQTAACNGQIFGKPQTRERAIRQIQASSGSDVHFYTSVALATGTRIIDCRRVDTTVSFRSLSPAEITGYVDREPALDCAGSFRWESLGISLFAALQSSDPTALEGLPLIALNEMLINEGINNLLSDS